MRLKFISAFFSIAMALVLTTASAFASPPLVNAAWVKANNNTPNRVFIDLRSKSAYLQGHVPGAIQSSYSGDKWRMKKGDIKGMLPSVDHLEKLIGRLGVSNKTHVILMHGGFSAAETAVATRIYWTFKVLGHNQVSILNGGMGGYLSDKSNPVEKGDVKPVAQIFKATINQSVLATAQDVKIGLSNGTTLLDSRPTDQYMGVNKSGSITRTGTLPGAISVPGRWVTVNDKGTFRNINALKKLYQYRNVSGNKSRIVFCNTGHWASLGWFVDSELLGNKTSRMYDGSIAEWSRLAPSEYPMEVKLKLQ